MEHNFKWKNDGRTKVMIGCGTRPEIIRLAAVIKRCREYFDCCVVYYNQNWDRNLSTVFWEDFELKNTFGGIRTRHSSARGGRKSRRDLWKHHGTQL